MRPEALKLLYDIGYACANIMEFTRGKSFEDYASDLLLRSGVERQFEIIGEALGSAIKKDPQIPEVIKDAEKIIAFRNLLIHGYFIVDNEAVWEIVKIHLPVLHEQVQKLLAENQVNR